MKKEILSYQSRIPAKLILFGEWAVLKGYAATGCSVGKYFDTTVSDHSNPNTFLIESPEASFEFTQHKNPPYFLQNTFAILEYLYDDLSFLNGKKVTLTRNWPLSEGLGSSSALFLSLALLGSAKPTPLELRQKLVEYQKGGSGFDILIQATGGFVSATIKEDVKVEALDLKIPEEIIFVHTGRKLKTEVAIKDMKNNPATQSIIKDIGYSAEQFFIHKDWEKTMVEHYDALKQLGVVSAFIYQVETEWKDKGWIKHLKTTGAGGGDTLMLSINACKRPELEEDLKSKGFWLEEAELGVPGALS